MKSQWKSYTELRELQNKKLRAIINHAYENIPFYREKFDKAGIHPSDIKTAEDLPKLPITTKQEVRDNFPHRIVAKGVNLNNCWLPHTSGSAGIPLNVAYDKAAQDFVAAVFARPYLNCGQGLFEKRVVITTPHDIAEQRRRRFQCFTPFRAIDIPMFLGLDKQISLIEQIKPRMLEGYSSAIYVLANRVGQRGIDIHPEIVFGVGELLTKEMREIINSTFGVEMFDQFGCVELGRTAWECPYHTGYHINMESVVIEFVRNGKPVSPGERGEILYTNLYNYAMPVIRYAVGDIGILSDKKCPCGRGLPMMKAVEGRSNSLIQVPSGRIFPAMTFWSIMGTFSGRNKISQFRIIGEKIDKIRIQVIPGNGFAQDTIYSIIRDVKHVIGDEVQIEVELVDEISRDESGKVRSVISNFEVDWSKV